MPDMTEEPQVRGRAERVLRTLTTLAVLGSCAPAVTATEIRDAGVSIRKLEAAGELMILSTGTGGGRCNADGRTIVCQDGRRSARGDLRDGCTGFEGSGYCVLASAAEIDGGFAASPEEPDVLLFEESRLDLKCPDGTIYTMTCAGGAGACGVRTGEDHAIAGASSSRGERECARVDCGEGCTGASRECRCEPRD